MSWSRLAWLCLAACSFHPPQAGDDDDMPRPDRVDTGLLATWKFDDGGATAADTFGGNPMSLTGTGATWTDGGLVFDHRAQYKTAPNPHIDRDVQLMTGAVTIEVWATTGDPAQGAGMVGTLPNYAVVFSISPSYGYRNATIAQVGDHWSGRVTTTGTNSNGLPSIDSAQGSVDKKPTHLVLVADGNDRVFYVDGVEHRSAPSGVGALSAWNAHFPVTVGDEIGVDRHWLGTIWFAAAYGRALSADEVKQNFDAGYDCPDC